MGLGLLASRLSVALGGAAFGLVRGAGRLRCQPLPWAFISPPVSPRSIIQVVRRYPDLRVSDGDHAICLQ